ncbi:Glycosylphosphatidylinositol anchor synthesis protein [Handroanthus impetiginosus]|uniref:Glycosylphosphatidylinositol anchor synthesis protein n=1 Tax=Handroanthus impetiginosus TaxID=429701 RepID=A0A2G9HHK4_9LAMI|nr:Glycosylphosphatidylinositol anchor synthesis protein [Handroanthus impetiginosus]
MPKKTSNYQSLTCTKLTLWTVSAVLIQIIGLSLFIVGFFPVKPTLSGMSGLESFYPPDFDSIDFAENISTLPPENLKSLYQELSGVPPLFDRLIIMVIDGLPAEFVLGKNGNPPSKVFMEAMPYVQSLLARGLAIGYHAKAAPPTVTMPRLKAMVSGAIGGFLDVASNFNAQAFLDDNLIAQFLRIGWKMVMLGDETWLKLFPNMFTRHDGVSSFFVKDTIQVDHNVSRHLEDELSSTDWDLLILHYLGLDHVGHIGGRNSILMGPKLSEMDEVIKRIHSSITQTQEINRRGTLLMIVSDHGMTEGGNHGGSSYEETDSLALFVTAEKIGDAENSKETYQVDIASTLAFLFGVPIPKNNVGTVMAEVFTFLEGEKQLRILELNSWQLLRLLKTHFSDLRCETFSCESQSGKNDGAERFCCSYLAASALHESWKSKKSSRSIHGDDYRDIVLAYNDFLGTASKWLSSRSTDWHLDEIFIVAVIFIVVLSMGSSSMVEEEQYIWHFMSSSLYLILLRKMTQSITSSCSIYFIIAALISGRILRGWHQGGVNWSYLPDISKLLEQAGTVHIKSVQLLSMVLVIICSAVLLALRLKIRSAMLLMLIDLLPVPMILKRILEDQDGTFTSSSISTTTTIQIIYGLLGTSTVGILVAAPWLMPLRKWKSCCDDLQESGNELLLCGFRDSIYVIGWCYVFSWCLLQMLLQQPINSMPVSLLLGISSHSTIISGILMFIITYASPMLALLSMLIDVPMKDVRAVADSQDADFGHLLKAILGYRCLVPLGLNSVLLLAYTIILLLMRNHLFIWSVFSPK